MVSRKVSILEETASAPYGACRLAWGEVSVIEKVTGYKKIKFHTHENAGYGDVRLPDMQMHTTSFWLTVPWAQIDEACARATRAIGSLSPAAAIDPPARARRALETVATIALMFQPPHLRPAPPDPAAG